MEKTIFLWALACSCALLYLDHSGQRWNFVSAPLFHRREIARWLPGACIALLGGWLISALMSGSVGISLAFYALLAWVVGGSMVAFMFRRMTGPVALIGAPLLTALTLAAPWLGSAP
ncbi:MAG: hypothetical protein J0H09_03690 [Burkholderiales bacterium]|nr:hypothetical protein [Burkholderiales bacterium]